MKVYVITNLVNNRKYVGQTSVSVEKRWQAHCWNSSARNMLITQAIKKYGKDSFKIEILEICDDLEALNLAEQSWIKVLNTLAPNGYNLTTGGKSNGRLSDQTKLKISKANTGKIRTQETLNKLSESHKNWVPSAETREKWRKAFTGIKGSALCYENSVKAIQKTFLVIDPQGIEVKITNMAKFCRDNGLNKSSMCEVIKGRQGNHKDWTASVNDTNKARLRTFSDATKNKMSLISQGHVVSIESRNKMSDYWTGRKRSKNLHTKKDVESK